jgi:O-antigen/teichoic acid export membrane protein
MVSIFLKNTLITFTTRISQLLLGIVTSIIIARVLGPEGKGIYTLAILLPMLLITFVNFGIAPASVYYIGKKKYSPLEIFGSNIIFSILLSIFAIIAGLVVIFFFGNNVFPGVAKEYLLLTLYLVPFQIFLTFVVNILLGLQRIKKYNFINLIHNFVFLVLIIIFLLGFNFEVKAVIIARILSFILACIVLFFLTKKEVGGVVLYIKKSLFKDFFIYGSKIYLISIFSFLLTRIDMFMINIFLNPFEVGFYSIAVGLSEKIWLISLSAGTVLFPKISSEINDKKLKEFTPLVCRNVLWITIFITILLLFLGPYMIVLFYSEQFIKSILPFQILLIGAIAISGSRILSNDLSGRGRLKENMYLSAFSVILNIVLNIILIPKFGITGAAWATAISYTIVFLGRIIIYSKISRNSIVKIMFIQKSDIALYRSFASTLAKRVTGVHKHRMKDI